MITLSQPTAGNRSSLGIDIGPGAIKAAVIRDDEMSLYMTHAVRMPTPPGSVDKAVIDIPAVADTIRQMVKEIGRGFMEAAIAVPAENTQVWWIELPSMDEASLRAATKFEARKYLTYPVEQAALQIVTFGGKSVADSPTTSALLVAVPRDIVYSRAEALEAAGLTVGCVEIDALALTRALQTVDSRRQMLWEGRSQAYLQLGEEQSSMSVMQAGGLQFVRAVSWGSGRLTEALSENLNVSAQTAKEIKEHATATITEAGVLVHDAFGTGIRETDAVTEELERLSRELRRLMNYYKSLFPEGSYEGNLDRIMICGGTARMSGLARYLTNRLEVECFTGDPFATKSVRMHPDAQAAVYGYETSYAVAVGLAIGGLQQAYRSVNVGAETEFLWRKSSVAAGVGA
jgi:type IV pilus assembly protein PilM